MGGRAERERRVARERESEERVRRVVGLRGVGCGSRDAKENI